jgi:hypothetical protein
MYFEIFGAMFELKHDHNHQKNQRLLCRQVRCSHINHLFTFLRGVHIIAQRQKLPLTGVPDRDLAA